jgi:hypothetical protein
MPFAHIRKPSKSSVLSIDWKVLIAVTQLVKKFSALSIMNITCRVYKIPLLDTVHS